MPLYIVEKPALNTNEIRAIARRYKRRKNIEFICIDYLGLIRALKWNASKVHQIEEITTSIKAMAKELDLPVLLLSQINRGVEMRENKRPTLSDLRDSGAIEQDADVVMFVYRDEYYLEKELDATSNEKDYYNKMDALQQARGKAEISIAKFRNGETSTVQLSFDGRKGVFYG